MLLTILSIIITIIFFLSGFNKFANLDSVARGLQNQILTKGLQIPIPIIFFIIVVIIAALLEIVMPLVIVYASVDKRYNNYGVAASITLAIFTILATLLYYFPPWPFYSSTYVSFMMHLSIIGGLFLLAYVFMYYHHDDSSN